MNSLWWLALPVLLLPIWWHRQRRERIKAQPLATARFLPRTDPQQLRVWEWADRMLLLVRCLLLAAVIAWLADLVVPWRGDTVLTGATTDPAWAEQQIGKAGFKDARRLRLTTDDALGWLREHEREWRDGARLLVLANQPMAAAMPRFRHSVELRSKAAPFATSEHHIAIVSPRAQQWRGRIDTFARGFAGIIKARPGLAQVQYPPTIVRGLILQDQGRHAEVSDLQPGRSTGVALLDATGQRAFGAHRDAVAAREHVANQQARRKDQLVVGPKRIASGYPFVDQDAGQQPAPTQVLPAFGNRLAGERLCFRVDSPDLHKVITRFCQS